MILVPPGRDLRRATVINRLPRQLLLRTGMRDTLRMLMEAHVLETSRPHDQLRRSGQSGLPWFVLISLFLAPLLARLYILSIPVFLNPDEAQWTVSARSVLSDPIVWRSTDMTTSGPLNALAISWPILFKITPSLLTSRLTGLLLESLSILGMASLIRPGEALSLGTAAVMTTAVWLTLAAEPDFLHYSSEIVSLALMVLFCGLFARLPDDVPGGPRLALCGFIATCLPFAKMQSALYFALFHFVCLVRIGLDIRAKRATASEILLYLLASSLPILLLVAPLFFVGEQDAVLKGYLGLGSGYGGARTLEIFKKVAPLTIVMGALMIVICLRYFDPYQRSQSRYDLLLLSLGLWPATLLSLWLPGRLFFHYQLFAVFGLPLSVVLAQYSLPPRLLRPDLPIAQALVLFAAAVAATSPILLKVGSWRSAFHQFRMDSAFAPASFSPDARPLLAWTGATTKDTLLLWGWEPELTAYAGMRSGDRAAHAEYLIRPNDGRVLFSQSASQGPSPDQSSDCDRYGTRWLFLHQLPRLQAGNLRPKELSGALCHCQQGFRAGWRECALRGALFATGKGRCPARRRDPLAKFGSSPPRRLGDRNMRRRLVGAQVADSGGRPDCRASPACCRTVDPCLARGGNARPRNDESADYIHYRCWKQKRECRAVAQLPRLDSC